MSEPPKRRPPPVLPRPAKPAPTPAMLEIRGKLARLTTDDELVRQLAQGLRRLMRTKPGP